MRCLALLAVVLMLVPEVPDRVIQLQQQLTFQERQFEALYAAFTSLREMAKERMRRLDELAALLRRDR